MAITSGPSASSMWAMTIGTCGSYLASWVRRMMAREVTTPVPEPANHSTSARHRTQQTRGKFATQPQETQRCSG